MEHKEKKLGTITEKTHNSNKISEPGLDGRDL